MHTIVFVTHAGEHMDRLLESLDDQKAAVAVLASIATRLNIEWARNNDDDDFKAILTVMECMKDKI